MRQISVSSCPVRYDIAFVSLLLLGSRASLFTLKSKSFEEDSDKEAGDKCAEELAALMADRVLKVGAMYLFHYLTPHKHSHSYLQLS